MAVKVGDSLPDGKLMESTGFDTATECAMPPQEVGVAAAAAGRKIVVFGVPGAFTPVCSARHVPSYIERIEEFKAKGVDEIWCVSVNDAFVMAHWGKEQHALGSIRFLGDGSATWAKALGLDADQTVRGMGVRMRRFSLLADNGVIKALNVEEPGKFEVSGGSTILNQA